ncbi:MAG: transporter substrate-binding domain-containing protein [Methanomicrobia archaeon]|nr:transporter substrate-binding domain-containing protein [Methanomicrobia archaeon]
MEIKAALVIVICVLMASTGSGCLSTRELTPTDLTYLTEQYPPFNYEKDGQLQGIAVELLEEVTAAMGEVITKDEIRLMPWTDSYQTTLNQPNTVLFSTARLPEREASFKWVGPIYTGQKVLFARRDREISINHPDDLAGYKIGVITDDAAISQLLALGVTSDQLVADLDPAVIITKLEQGELDLWCYGEDAGNYFIKELTGRYGYFKVVYTLQDYELYYAFNKETPDTVIESFQEALDRVKAREEAGGLSQYERIVARYSPSSGLGYYTYLTEEFPPLNYNEDDELKGVAVDLLDAVFTRLNIRLTRADIRLVQWPEAYHAGLANNTTVVFSMARVPEREELFQWAGPFVKDEIVLFGPRSRNITIATPADLKNYRIGAIANTSSIPLLLAQGVDDEQLVLGESATVLIAQLERGELDLWSTGELSGWYLIAKHAARPEDIERVYTLHTNEYYFAFSRDTPDTLVTAFQQALEDIRLEKDAQGVSEYERILYRYLEVECVPQPLSEEVVIQLVNLTATAIETDVHGTFHEINLGEDPYKNRTHQELYIFVYDTNVTMVADADNIKLVGVTCSGKTDVTGKPFRDEIVAGALQNGSGWVEYLYINPVETGLYLKKTYYQLIRGSDGQQYVICCGVYKRCS